MSLPSFMQKAFVDNLQKKAAAPSSTTIYRAGFVIDCAMLLWQRKQACLYDSYRWMWSDSSPLKGVDWLWSQCIVIHKHRILEVFAAFIELCNMTSDFVSRRNAVADDPIALADLPDVRNPLPEWQPPLAVLRMHIRLFINTPAAMGPGRRSLADKVACEVHKWHLQTPPTACLGKLAKTFMGHCGDMGTEFGTPTFNVTRPEVMLPSWIDRSALPADTEGDQDDDHIAEPEDGLEDDQMPETPGAFLPCCFEFAGLQHVFDNMVKDIHNGCDYSSNTYIPPDRIMYLCIEKSVRSEISLQLIYINIITVNSVLV